MSRSLIILIIAAVILAGIIAAVISFVTISNKAKSKKLQENIEKYKKENSNNGLGENLDLSKNVLGENVTEEEIFSNNQQPVSNNEFFAEENNLEPPQDTQMQMSNADEDYPRMPEFNIKDDEQQAAKNRDQEFEDFLDEHAFSRKVFDKNMLEQIQELTPEQKLMLMENIFHRIDDGGKK